MNQNDLIYHTAPVILIVDDTTANLQVLSGMLKEHGYKTRAALSGRLALQAAHNNPPDLILLDINMPEMDGYEVCQLLKADQQLRDIPVIFISALSEAMDKVKAFEVGGVDYVTKPFQLAEVEARVSTHLRLHRYQSRLEQMVAEQVQEISNAQMNTILALSKLAESRDDDTGKHLERVQAFCRILAAELRVSSPYASQINDTFINDLANASPLHDVGKVGIPDAILLKPGKLTPDEFAVMKTHTTIGAQTLDMVGINYPHNAFIQMGIMIARSHHEKWDGSGYPDGLSGDQIPLSARIMAVADVYDALRSKRCYKEAFSHDKSRSIILSSRGTHLDPVLIDAFNNIAEDFNHIRMSLEDDIPVSAVPAN